MWSGHSSDQTGVLDVTIQCQLNMATNNLKQIATNIAPAATGGAKFRCHSGSPPMQGQMRNSNCYNSSASVNVQGSTQPYYENITPTKTFSSCEYASDGNVTNVFVTPTGRSAFQPVNPNVRLGQTVNSKSGNANSPWNKFVDGQKLLNDSGYGSPGLDFHYSHQFPDFNEQSDFREIPNQTIAFDQQGIILNSVACEQQLSASCTFRNSFGTTFSIPAENRPQDVTTFAKQTSTGDAFFDDDMKIAMKEKDVTQRLYVLKTKGYESAQEVEDFYQSQTTMIDIERHNILRQMAYDKTSSESINGYYNRKLLSVLESVEQKISEIEQNKSKAKQSQKRSRLLPKAAVKILESWYQDNLSNPYPSREVTLTMAAEGGITVEQIRKWFANKRNRSRNSKLKASDAVE